LKHDEAAAAATALLAGAHVWEVQFQAMSWVIVLSRSENGRCRQFRISSDSDVSADSAAFVDMERDAGATMRLLHGLIDGVVERVEALGPMHYRIVFDAKTLVVREQGGIVDNAMIVAESPRGDWILCG
jgi:hypothetical protein